MDAILDDYRALLSDVDAWFSRCLKESGPGQIRCAGGCSACCRGLFDITLLDGYLLQQGLNALPAALREAVLVKARQNLGALQQRWPGFAPPYLLNTMADEEWTEMPEDDATPCPLLGADGRCLVYAQRPMLCRLHGLPHIDLSGESFEDGWCTLNFPGVDPRQLPELRWHFRQKFAEELQIFRRFAARLTGTPRNELDIFIPTALLIDFAGTDWPRVVSRLP